MDEDTERKDRSEKMDEDVESKDRFVVPSPPIRDSKTSFVGSIQAKHGRQTTSTPYVGSFQASGGVNLKRNYDSGCDPALSWETPISKAPHYGDNQSYDTLNDTETPVEYPQLNLLPCFEERAEEKVETEESQTIQADFGGDASVWRDRLPTQKRRSLEVEKSPSPYRSKRYGMDVSCDSGCFSTRSDLHFSSELLPPHLPSVSLVNEITGRSTFTDSVCNLPIASAPSLLSHDNVDLSVRSSDGFRSSLTPSIGEKVSQLQLVLTCDSGCSVTSMDTSEESAFKTPSNSTPSFGEKPLKLPSILPIDRINPTDTRSRCPSSFGERVSKLVPSESAGEFDVNVIEMSKKSTHSNPDLSSNYMVSQLQPTNSRHSLSRSDRSSAQVASSEPVSPSCDFLKSQSTLTPDVNCETRIEKAKLERTHESSTSVEETRLVKKPHELELVSDIPEVVNWSRMQTFHERLAMRKMKLDQEIGLRIGKRYVDIIRELGRKMFTEPLAKVFSYLSEEELCSVCLVSHHWKAAVELETNARIRRRNYIQENRQRMAETPQENRSKLMNPSRLQNFTNPNKPMAQIQTTEELPTAARTVIPLMHTKSEEFFKEARSLDRTESLRKCPLCESPARASEKDRRARCTKAKCRYEFCVFCRKLFHGGTDCASYVRNPAPTKIGSRQSKQNLRRL